MSNDELACTYASLILYDAGIAVTAGAISKLTSAAKVPVNPFWPNFFENVLKGQDIGSLILNSGSAAPVVKAPVASTTTGSTTTASTSTPATPAPEPVEEKKKKKTERENMGGFSLFD
eukprot:TRINITY_DN42_c0_g1_i10.p1 TRINITY_DN42_c0_g1~~TRINITY_DN42_c0_g1_i10.p1  ORF type:complete len:130 (-),score=33.92 TRINITY_DN42_c0_g1_i10:2-355(-)